MICPEKGSENTGCYESKKKRTARREKGVKGLKDARRGSVGEETG